MDAREELSEALDAAYAHARRLVYDEGLRGDEPTLTEVQREAVTAEAEAKRRLDEHRKGLGSLAQR